jgi:hypothetical protein
VDPVPDQLLLRKSGSAGNRTRDLWICSRELWPLDHRGGQWDQYQTKIAESFPVPFCPSCMKDGQLSGTPLCKNITAQFVSLQDISKRYWSTAPVLSSWEACERSFPNSHWAETMASNECWGIEWWSVHRPHDTPLTPPRSFRSPRTVCLVQHPFPRPFLLCTYFLLYWLTPRDRITNTDTRCTERSEMEHPVSVLRDHTNPWVYKTPQHTSKMSQRFKCWAAIKFNCSH